MTNAPPFTVIIPAHNEEAVIARCLQSVREGAPEDADIEIIVAANGCADHTAEIARRAAPNATVLELREGSKTAAINAANKIAKRHPRIVLDADCECQYGSLLALAEALRVPGIMTAAPSIHMNLSKSNWLVRAYYRVWLKQPYAQEGKGGAGCYGLSRDALEKIGEFPKIIADDIWIHTRFADEEKRFVTTDQYGDPVFSIVYPPRTALEQIRVEARRQSGNAELWQLHPSGNRVRSGGADGIRSALRRNSNPIDVVIFFAMKLAARLVARWNRLRGRGTVWSRDLSSRET